MISKMYHLSRIVTLALVCAVLSFATSCKKDDDDQAKIDEEIILDYLAEHDLTATSHSSGLYYYIHNRGDGSYPNIYSYVQVKYKGWLTDGTVFDQTTGYNTYSQNLYTLIEGWQIGIPLLKPGGKITLYVPSRLGYKNSTAGVIPANSVLIFDVELISYQ